jgi:membrane-associated phospholipid phosphatase
MIWGTILCLAVLAALWCRVAGLHLVFTMDGVRWCGIVIGGWAAFFIYCRVRLPKFVPPLQAVAQVVLLGIVMAILQYPATSAGGPTADAALAAFDQRLGIDWQSIFVSVWQNPLLFDLLRRCYLSLLPQLFPVIFLVGILDPQRLKHFVTANTLGQALTILGAVMWPAAGEFVRLHLPFISDPLGYPAEFEAVRNGTLRVLHESAITGIIQFPSYHAMLAVFIMNAVARLPGWIMCPIWTFEILIIFSTPAMGGHYIADVVAGIVAALLSIAAARALHSAGWRDLRRFERRTPQREAAPQS